MAEPRARSGPLQIYVDYAFDRLRESKLAQAYDILVPRRERPVGGRVKEFDDEDDGNLRAGLVRAAAPRPTIWRYPKSGSSKMKAIVERRSSARGWSVCGTSPPKGRSRWCSRTRRIA